MVTIIFRIDHHFAQQYPSLTSEISTIAHHSLVANDSPQQWQLDPTVASPGHPLGSSPGHPQQGYPGAKLGTARGVL